MRPTYRWHHNNRKILWPILLVTGMAIAGLSLAFLPAKILIFGCIMGGGVFLYAIMHQGMPGKNRIYLLKEGWISILYTAGIWGVPLLSSPEAPGIRVWLTILFYTGLVGVNVLIYALHDPHLDGQESQQTFATRYGRQATFHLLKLLILSILMLILVASLTLDDLTFWKVYLILLVMTALLGGSWHFLICSVKMKGMVFLQMPYLLYPDCSPGSIDQRYFLER
jgi:4-hydroxybenzoate polyprenyltransferase